VFQPLGRSNARLMLEGRLRILRRAGQQADYDRLQHTYKQTFQ
jgi:PII interaction protein X